MSYVKIEIKKGNVNHNHIYLSSVIEFFPPAAIGGSNYKEEALVKLEIHCGVCEPVTTDIAGDKKIFRTRNWEKEFFQAHDLMLGDFVIIEHMGENRYHIFPSRA